MPDSQHSISTFSFNGITIRQEIPDLETIRAAASTLENEAFPFWAKLWPSAIALCRLITGHPELIANKNVLELAAGLGLPGIVAAHLAKEVVISDYHPQAVTHLMKAISINGLKNTTAQQLDWYHLPPELKADVLLLSDINYDPVAFETLHKVLLHFLDQDTTILLTTPQRLMAKPFIKGLLPYCSQQEEMEIKMGAERTFISAFVLRKN